MDFKFTIILFLVPVGTFGQNNCIAPELACDRPPYCNHTASDVIADPDDCHGFYKCVNFEWQSDSCGATIYFSSEFCGCTESSCVNPITCPSTTLGTPPPAGTCEDVESPCTVGEKFADVSDCEYYYECVGPLLPLERFQCGLNTTCPPDNQPGGPCVFDIYLQECTRPNAYFDCDYRCIVTMGPTTESDDVTTTTQHFTGSTTTVMTTTDIETGPGDDDNDGLPGWAVALIVIILIIPLIVVPLVIYIVKKTGSGNQVAPSEGNESPASTDASSTHDMGDTEQMNPNLTDLDDLSITGQGLGEGIHEHESDSEQHYQPKEPQWATIGVGGGRVVQESETTQMVEDNLTRPR